jgi:hypothetical protein
VSDSPGTRAKGGWSPFARPPWRDCEAAAKAVLRALDLDGCALHDLSEDRYVAIRDRAPGAGLPRVTTLTRACGSWASALEQAAALAAAGLREGYAT